MVILKRFKEKFAKLQIQVSTLCCGWDVTPLTLGSCRWNKVLLETTKHLPGGALI